MSIRVVSYNVSGGLDVGAAGEVLTALAPQLVCLQEVTSGNRLRRLARLAGLEVVGRSGRKGTGTAILGDGDVTVRATSTVPLSTPKDVRTREATHALVSVRGLRLSVTSVQFGLRPDVRMVNLGELRAFLGSFEAPNVVGADLNTSPRSPIATELAAQLQDAFAVAGSGSGVTYPTSDPSTRQDVVLVDPALSVTACRVADAWPVDVASHHRPVVADLDRAPTAEAP